MAVSSNTPTSISDIEQQIATVTAQLEQARAQQLVTAEKSYLAAQKAAELAQNKMQDLAAKPRTSLAAQNRLLTATAAAEQQNLKLAEALEIFEALKAQEKAAGKFAKKVGRVLAGKKIGKKIKFTHAEKAIIKEDKKAAKKLAKVEKKAQKRIEKEIQQTEVVTSVSEAQDIANKPVKKLPVKKPIAKKESVEKEAIEKQPIEKVAVKKAPAKKATPKKNEPIVAQLPEEISVETQSTNPENIALTESVETPSATSTDSPVETAPSAEPVSESRDPGVENLDENADA